MSPPARALAPSSPRQSGRQKGMSQSDDAGPAGRCGHVEPLWQALAQLHAVPPHAGVTFPPDVRAAPPPPASYASPVFQSMQKRSWLCHWRQSLSVPAAEDVLAIAVLLPLAFRSVAAPA